MPETALAVRSNLSHNVPAAIEAAKTRLTDLVTFYLATEVAGQSQATLDAKRRDLKRFLAFYHQLYGHHHPEEWFVSVTKAFLKQLRGHASRRINALANMVMLKSASNKKISARAPADYLLEVEKAAGPQLHPWLNSNLIPPTAFAAAKANDYDAFLVERAAAIHAEIQRLTGW